MNIPVPKLRAKILGLILGISLVTLAAMIAIVIVFIKPRLEAKLAKRGQSIAHAISTQCISPILTGQLLQLDMLFREFVRTENDLEYIYVVAPQGEITAHSFGRDFPLELKTVKPLVDKDGHGIARITTGERELVDISLPVLDGTLGRIHVGMSAASIKKDVNDILLSFTSIAGLLFLAALLLQVFLDRWVIRPIGAIRKASLSVQGGNLDKRVAVISADEIGSLAAEFNRMLDTIKESRANLLEEKVLLTQSEEKLRASESSYQIFTSITSDFVYRCLRRGTEPFRIQWIAGATEEITGYTLDELKQMTCWLQIVHPADKERVNRFLLGLNSGDRAAIDFRIITKGGDVRWIHESSYCEAGDVPGELLHYGSSQDITSRKAVEHEIQRLNRDLEALVAERTGDLIRSNRDLASFCYAISHELRAPVARLKGLSQALQEEWAENPADAVYCARRIEVASSELQRVINSVLQLSRLSQASFVPQPLNLSKIVREITGSLTSENPQRQFALTIADELTASGDPALVRLCLENLLGNAFKYTAHEPVARIEFGRDAASGAFFVKDNGIGFDMNHADNLFEPFIRLQRDEEFSGSGIGLATVQRIVDRHGGRIWAESVPGEGATFFFKLSESYGDSHDA